MEEPSAVAKHHPYGIEPFGNLFTNHRSEGLKLRTQGLGQMACMKDELLLEMLWYLGARDVCRLGCVSKALYAWHQYEDLWKALLMAHLQDNSKWLTFHGSWKESYQRECAPHSAVVEVRPIKVPGLYSDLLFYRWWCANAPLEPAWISVDNIHRVHRPTPEEFREHYEVPNMPVLITGVVTEWPAFKKWDNDYLVSLGGDTVPFHGGGLSFSLPAYFSYAKQNKDDLPLYLFDKATFDKVPVLADEYTVPEVFSEDLFSVLGQSGRPDYRWLIVGPANSGSSFHKDPNCTSAWNAVIRGKKKWIFFPPHVNPPGVHPSKDGLDLATPITLVEWFTSFYKEALKAKVKPIQCIAEAGDLVFVPSGWWHLVVNLEDSTAITQNYVSSVNLPRVLTFLDTQKHLISGCPEEDRPTLYDRFVKALQAQKPEVLAKARQQQLEHEAARREKRKFAFVDTSCFQKTKAAHGGESEKQQPGNSVTSGEEGKESSGGFCFGFFG